MKATFHAVGDKQLHHFYSIDIEKKEGGWRVVYFNSKIHVNKCTRIGPGATALNSPTTRFSSTCYSTPYRSSAATSFTARTATPDPRDSRLKLAGLASPDNLPEAGELSGRPHGDEGVASALPHYSAELFEAL